MSTVGVCQLLSGSEEQASRATNVKGGERQACLGGLATVEATASMRRPRSQVLGQQGNRGGALRVYCSFSTVDRDTGIGEIAL